MNRIFKIGYFLFFMGFLGSCKKDIDNYDAPNGGITGTVYDSETNEPIPLPVQGNSGTLVSLFERNTNASVSIDFRAKQDGSFTNSTVFNGDYRVLVDGPFVGVCEGYVTIKGQTTFDLKAIPFSRISAEATISDDNKVSVSYSVATADESFTLNDVSIMWNYAPGVDINTANYVAKISKGTVSNGTQVFDLLNDKQFVENLYKIQANGNKVYVRVAATVNKLVNYSKVIVLVVH
ncbi:Protein of unknown function [bacterium A37T11]|nr:Protein of unknown function [bacterium A37T11]